MKIFICGPSGMGKTTLAKWIAEQFNMEFVSTSSKGLWKKYMINSHEELIQMAMKSPGKGYKFQTELLDIREKLIDKNPHFVTDRSIVDNLVYYLMQVAPFVKEKLTLEYIDRCKTLLDPKWQCLDLLIHIPFNRKMLIEDDGFRISNRVFQECTQLYFDYCLDTHFSFLLPYHKLTLATIELDQRKLATQSKIQSIWYQN